MRKTKTRAEELVLIASKRVRGVNFAANYASGLGKIEIVRPQGEVKPAET